MYYTTLAWPATCKHYRIERLDMRGTVTLLHEVYDRPMYGYEAPEDDPALLLIYPMLGKEEDLKGKPYAFPVNDPPSLATIRWLIRAALNDTEIETGIDLKYPENPKWPDRELDGYIRECIGLFNTYLPRERKVRSPVDQLTRASLGLTDDEHVKAVAYDSTLLSRSGQLITMRRASRQLYQVREPQWDLDATGELRVNFLDQHGTFRPLEISVVGNYTIPANDRTALNLAREHWEILSIYAQGKAHLRLAGQSAQLDRWKETGIRSDNPITPIARRLLNEAMERITGMKGPMGMRRIRQ